MAMLLLLHALATPGVLIGENGLVQAAGALNVPIGGLILVRVRCRACAACSTRGALLRLQVATLTVLALVGVTALVVPGLIPAAPRPGTTAPALIFLASAPLLALLAHSRAYVPAHPAAAPTRSSPPASCCSRAPSSACCATG